MADSDPLFSAFCAAGLWRGLGQTLAAALSAAGIHQPEDVTTERLRALPKVGVARAQRLLNSWIEAAPAFEVARLLMPVGLPLPLAGRAVAQLGKDAARQLREDPWRLLELFGARLADADRLAVATIPGVRKDDPRRGRALACHALARASRDGHTLVESLELQAALSSDGVANPLEAIQAAIDSGLVVEGLCPPEIDDESDMDNQESYGLARYAMAEDAIAEAIRRLTLTAEPFSDAVSDVDIIADDLDDTQRNAVKALFTHGVSVLTGGPGTGKSRTIAAVVRLAEKYGKDISLAAPTGRAAKRLSELTEAPASTIHRLLGAQGGRGSKDDASSISGRQSSFTHDEDCPLETDIVVIDEVSMMDAELAAALLEACAEGTHLLLVGDPAQLPSIGAGRVLADIIESGVVPVTELTTLYRQAEGGAIARLATSVRQGELPMVEPTDREVVVVPAANADEIAHRVRQLIVDSIPRALKIPVGQVQIVTPIHDGPAGTVALNRALKAALNPGRGTVSGFDVGDRVVAIANHLEIEPNGFANGEIGVVIDAVDKKLTVEFASGPVTVSGQALSDLRHGWAVTVHRAQGSEWPGVIVVLPTEASTMLSRPLVYTAFTRAQRHLSIVHSVGHRLSRTVRDVGIRPRRTQLRFLLAEGS